MLKQALKAVCTVAVALLLPALAHAAPDGDSAACAGCHEKAAQTIAASKHGVKADGRTPFGLGKDCSSCHGNVGEHLKDPIGAKPSTLFGKLADAASQNASCTNCHKGGSQMHWKGSAHDRSDVTCTSCHKAHGAKDQVLVAQTQAGVCFDCHKDVRADSMKISTHPVKNGWLPCSSCHNAHGSVGPAAVTKQSINQTCYTCHADKRGPYLWQHTPVQENCANCHTPHGSNVNGLLVARTPMLCQQCHESGGSTHINTLFQKSYLPAAAGAQPSNGTGRDLVVGKNCLECHGRIHGSNNPSAAGRTLRN